jgi:hypothetical protein
VKRLEYARQIRLRVEDARELLRASSTRKSINRDRPRTFHVWLSSPCAFGAEGASRKTASPDSVSASARIVLIVADRLRIVGPHELQLFYMAAFDPRAESWKE